MLDSLTAVSPQTAPVPPQALMAPEGLAAAPRGIVPRRPLRLSTPRGDGGPDPRRSLAALNIFADIYDPDPAPQPDSRIDPRVAASRQRARRLLNRDRDDPSAPLANFWHPGAEDDPPPRSSLPASATIAANDIPDLPRPLQEQLLRVRTALYAEGLTEDAETLAAPSTQLRLASVAMNATLVVVAFPVGAAVTLYSLLRGSDIRISAQAMAIVAAVTGAWHSGLGQLL